MEKLEGAFRLRLEQGTGESAISFPQSWALKIAGPQLLRLGFLADFQKQFKPFHGLLDRFISV